MKQYLEKKTTLSLPPTYNTKRSQAQAQNSWKLTSLHRFSLQKGTMYYTYIIY